MPRQSSPDAESLRAEMLDHAARVFAKGDFHRTKTRDLAVPGKFSEGRFFIQFGNKDGVLRAMFHAFWKEMYERSHKETESISDPVKRVYCLVQVAVNVFREHEHLFRVTAVNCYPPGSSSVAPGADYHAKYRDVAFRCIIKAIRSRKSESSALDVRLVYLSLLGAIQYSLNELYRERHLDEQRNKVPFSVEDIERHLRFHLAGFFGTDLGFNDQSVKRPGALTEKSERESAERSAKKKLPPTNR